MTQSIETKYRRLSDVEHVLLRPGRYIGSVKPKTAMSWLYEPDAQRPLPMVQREATWNPGFIKLFDEIISNSVDFSKTPEGKRLDTIKVDVDRANGTISVYDNGGIPVVLHSEYDEYIPSLIFGYLRSGSNFDDRDDSDLTGQNGEGASLTNIFSTSFTVETSDGKKRFKQTWTKNMMEKTTPQIIETEGKGYTRITYTPDYAHLDTKLDDDNYAKIVKRVYDVAGCNPRLKVYLNGERIKINSFKDYVGMFVDAFEYDENKDWQIAVTKSEDGFQHVAFVNSTETIQGGTHVSYVVYQIAHRLREYFKKKHKVDVKPTDIFAHMRLFINARIINPRYDSQTKENLMTEPKEYRTSWSPDEKFIQRIIKSDIIEKVLEWVAAKEHAANMAKLKSMNKEADKFNPRRIIKLQDANLAGKEPEKCILFLAEGDSAAKPAKGSGDRDTMGFLALRGVPLNFAKASPEKIAANKETFNIMAAMGLKIGEKVKSISQLRYGKLATMTDADHDGAGHITGLIISNLYYFWPELFEMGVIHRFVTPLVRVWPSGKNKQELQFFEEHEYKTWRAANPDFKGSMKYYKGLGTSEEEDFPEYFTDINKHLIKLSIEQPEDSEVIGLVFNKGAGSADRRKKWLALTEDGDDLDIDIDDEEAVDG